MDVTMRIETSRALTDDEAEALFDALVPLEVTDVVLVDPQGGENEESAS